MKIKSFIPTVLLMILIAATAYTLGNKGMPVGLSGALAQKAKSETISSISFEQARENILRSIQTMDGSIIDVQIEPTPLTDIYWVILPGNEAIVMSGDGRYFLGRGVSEFKNGNLEPVLSDILETAKAEAQKEVREVFESENSGQLIYAAEGGKKGEIFVFTDVNCGYCRKFHKDVPTLNKAGIEVRYFAGPFFSKDRASLEKIWCSENALEAMNQVKAGQKIADVEITEACQNTVSQHMALGQKLGIRGTPAIYTVDGEQIGGYVPPEQIIERFIQ